MRNLRRTPNISKVSNTNNSLRILSCRCENDSSLSRFVHFWRFFTCFSSSGNIFDKLLIVFSPKNEGPVLVDLFLVKHGLRLGPKLQNFQIEIWHIFSSWALPRPEVVPASVAVSPMLYKYLASHQLYSFPTALQPLQLLNTNLDTTLF